VNIYVTDVCPFKSAESLDDARLVMSLQYNCQVLRTIADTRTGTHKVPMLNDPAVRWAMNDKHNLWWIMANTSGLSAEYKRRFKREHAATPLLYGFIEYFGFESPRVLMFQNRAYGFTQVKDVTVAYKLFLDSIWIKSKPRWTNAKPPEWYIENSP
jgi:hypothetical protein